VDSQRDVTKPRRVREWARHRTVSDGLELLEAAFEHHVYERHIHETYAVGFTLRGVQRFWCRGATRHSTPGNVIAINPGEAHDGQSGAAGGYAYRMFYISVDRLQRIVEESKKRRVDCIGARAPLVADRMLAQKLDAAWQALDRSPDSLAADELLHDAFLFLGAGHYSPRLAADRLTLDHSALRRVRDYLHDRVGDRVSVRELAVVASISRFQLTRQFQQAFGLPLHAYHLHVRLEEAKARLRCGEGIASVAADLGFVDQSHFHRRFKGSFGLTPGEWQRSAATRELAGDLNTPHTDTRPTHGVLTILGARRTHG
jgi:AraC-like DNA-binding protein